MNPGYSRTLGQKWHGPPSKSPDYKAGSILCSITIQPKTKAKGMIFYKFSALVSLKRSLKKIILVMKLTILFIVVGCLNIAAKGFGQHISLHESNARMETVFKKIEKQCEFRFYYRLEVLKDIGPIKVDLDKIALEVALDKIFEDKGLSYEIIDKVIVITEKKESPAKMPESRQREFLLKGRVVEDKSAAPISLVNISVKGTQRKTFSDKNGNFTIGVNTGETLVFSYLGFEKKEVAVKDATVLTIRLSESSQSLKEVVATGIFDRPKESYTGASTSFTSEDIAKVSNTSLLTALRTLDPSFQITENNNTGSNPNILPNVSVRGGNSLPDLNARSSSNLFNYANDINTPLFILDGFETTLQRIVDLDVSRIARVEILKDASATAIYGSRAANGVVVIETNRPKGGQLTVSYNVNMIVETPDISDYDLLNASEKLALEKSVGIYQSSANNTVNQALQYYYNARLAEVQSGVNTNWMALPLRNTVSQRHNIFVESGANGISYGLGGSYNQAKGVMKGSDRLNASGNSYIAYRLNTLTFRNEFSYSANKANNSPYGSFATYVRMNPYLTPYDANGGVKKQLEDIRNNLGGPIDPAQFPVVTNPIFNPTLHTIDQSKYTNLLNNFFVQLQATQWLRLSGRFAATKQTDESDLFLPAQHTSFINTPTFQKGSYVKAYGSSTSLEGSFSADVNKEFGKHLIFATLNANLSERSFETVSYMVNGFPNSRLDEIHLGRAYPADAKPQGSESLSRRAGVLSNVSYSYDNRFLFDLSYRLDGSSQFGTEMRFASFWSAGTGWNIHKETFMRNYAFIDRLKLRYSYGRTGSQNFASFLGISTSTYYTDRDYNGMVGTYLLGYGNPDLAWQVTNKGNVGLDLTLFKRLDLTANYFMENTKGSVATISSPPSVGFSSYTENIGDLRGKGWELNLGYKIISRPESRDYWSVLLRTFSVNRKIIKVSDNVKEINRRNSQGFGSTPLPRYAEGQSLTAIWAVPSLGIDPANGLEVFRNSSGGYTNAYDPSLQTIVGDTQSKMEGSIGSNLEIKGIGMSVFMRFRYGGQVYNQTLIDRVENVNIRTDNVDRRVLEQRWQKPGDVTFFKGLTNGGGVSTTPTSASSRFVQDDNLINCESLSVYYRLPESWNRKSRLKNTKVSIFTSNLFNISSVKRERGIDYPFSQTYSIQLQTSL